MTVISDHGTLPLPRDLPDDVLQEARVIMNGPRQKAYGDPVENCARIGRIWGALLRIPDIPPATVAHMMSALKLARETGTNLHHRDNLVDAAAYQLIAERCHESVLQPSELPRP